MVPRWTLVVPLFGLALLGATVLWPVGTALAWLCAAALIAAVQAAVYHAEVVAHRLGEPFGTLVLALAVTVIEAALILSVMLASGTDKTALARDTIFSAVMIICNGVVGLCLVVGGLRHHEQSFRVEGATSSLAALVALSTLSLVLPSFTITSPGPSYSPAQLAFAALASLVMWAVYVFAQTVKHRDYFLPPSLAADGAAHAAPPRLAQAWLSFCLLIAALVAVVGLAKALSPSIEAALAATGAPKGAVGIAIALLVLLPETLAAVRAAHLNRLQTSFNLAYGSALASIGLTIPVVAIASLWLGIPLTLGLDHKDMVLLVLTFVVSTLTLAFGRTHMLQGAVHLVIFAAFAFLAFVP
ncbi:MAG TPA: ionic transporter y4hA [Burkholderiaceae bacterium]|nr:ionic transporter y4hA [Burkholderiaceae bacterium]